MAPSEQAFRAGRVGKPKGTNDLIPSQSWGWEFLRMWAWQQFGAAGYAPIETPIFEHTEVFERGVGATSDVVTKQMYTFEDRGGRSLTLRPEGTAPTIRAVLEHGLHKENLPVKLFYAGPMFRQERPQKGRYRQFLQIGIEAIGSDDPRVDAEVIHLGMNFLRAAGVDPALFLNSIGHPEENCRGEYLSRLLSFLRENEASLAPEDRDRIERNPLRTFDSKEPTTIAVMQDAPTIVDHLCDKCREHFEKVRALLDDLEISYSVEPRLVRGLDYYTRTAFEFVAEGLGSQNAVGGGGRYDGLSEALGGPPLPGIGFALGADRILLVWRDSDKELVLNPVVYIVSMGEEAQRSALKLAKEFRQRQIPCDLELMGRSLKGQMKEASKSSARYAAILGEEELAGGFVTLKDLESGDQERARRDEIVELVQTRWMEQQR